MTCDILSSGEIGTCGAAAPHVGTCLLSLSAPVALIGAMGVFVSTVPEDIDV